MLVTGACGMVGRRVVRDLAARGERVVAVDLDTPATVKVARRFGAGVTVAHTDLTRAGDVATLVLLHNPRAVLHLAAVIPPAAYARPAVAEAVNVGGTQHLVAALQAHVPDSRFVLASSVAVYGSRNGARELGPLTPDTRVAPRDNYGAHKVAAEAAVRASDLTWVVLRIGAVVASDLVHLVNPDAIFMGGVVPRDSRIHTVDVDDVAAAFVAAADAPVAGCTLLVGGDDTHRLRQVDLERCMRTIAGLGGGPSVGGRDGDPADDSAWFVTDWMDTSPTWAALGHRPRRIDETVDACRAELSPLRALLRPLGPLARHAAPLISPYRRAPGRYADVWTAVSGRYGPAALA